LTADVSRARAAALLLLFALPLALSPLTVELGPQKVLVASLGLPLCALAAPSIAGSLSLGLGLLLLFLRPSSPWPTLALAAAPSAFAAFSLLARADRAFLLRLVRLAAISECLVALAGAAGLLPLDTSAFHLPHKVFVGTLGNPNHLASFLLLALPFCAVDLKAERRALRAESGLALALSILVILLSRSHLAALVLACQCLAFALRPRLRLALAACAIVPIVLGSPGFFRALEGRFFLSIVHARGFSLQTLLLGMGPGEVGPRFLDWQAEHLAAHPEALRFWTYPEHPHNDLFFLLLSFGIVLLAAGGFVARRCLKIFPLLPPGPIRAAWLAIALIALGSGVLVSPVTWAMALLVAAFSFASRTSEPQANKTIAKTNALLACAWLVLSMIEVFSAYHHREALRAAAEKRDLGLALKHVEEAIAWSPKDPKLLHLKGRVLLEAGRPAEALRVLLNTAKMLPHPVVWKALVAAANAANEPEIAKTAARSWLTYRPQDAAALDALAPR